MKKDIYVIKLWSNVLLDNSWIDQNIISNLAKQVDLLKQKWIWVIIVSSWAVALWKKKLW